MDWLFENFQLVALVLIAFAGWLKSRTDAKNEQQEPPEVPEDERDVFSPDEQWERASGVPPPLTWSEPPPIPTPAAAFETARETAAALKHQQDLAERLRQIRETKATTTGGAAATRARVAASKAPGNAMLPVAVSLRSRLRDKGELRRAFVLKEILEPPLSQR